MFIIANRCSLHKAAYGLAWTLNKILQRGEHVVGTISQVAVVRELALVRCLVPAVEPYPAARTVQKLNLKEAFIGRVVIYLKIGHAWKSGWESAFCRVNCGYRSD